ncbi:response regulator [Streptomyces sp. NPDC059740]|uniref:DUF7342 family protein n=1 Tax=Streptomyces sp. NPDC059740 TaxID=3346926 RepID=UPI0036539F83
MSEHAQAPGGERPGLEVLVVDDDRAVARVHAAYVDRIEGFRVRAVAHTCQEALALLRSEPVDLVLLDHYLPDGDGLDLVARIRRQGVETDVIMVTAARDVATVRAAMRLGALHYLVKPFTFADLRARMEAYARLLDAFALGDRAEQSEVDALFGTLGTAGAPTLPKGHSTATADRVTTVLRAAPEPLSAQAVAELAGVSRQTAQRYLKLLERTGRVRLSLRYGETGRPEHRYAWV